MGMRKKHLKFHLFAIAAISLLIIVLYMLFGPTPNNNGEPALGDNYIRIDNATWGKNCDPYIAQGQQEWRPPAADDKNPAPQPSYAQHNNALESIRKLCEGLATCRLRVDNATMGVDPLRSCYKRLVMGYRCTTFDRLWTRDLGQGDVLTIDCRPGAKHQTDPVQN